MEEALSSLFETFPEEDLVEGEFARLILRAHNDKRAQHACHPLVYCPRLAEQAQDWAERIIRKNTVKHEPKNVCGENIFACAGNQYVSDEEAVSRAVNKWYGEVNNYSKLYDKEPTKQEVVESCASHFVQVVWASSQVLGAGLARGRNNMLVVVCNYFPPGNLLGRYKVNVPRLLWERVPGWTNEEQDLPAIEAPPVREEIKSPSQTKPMRLKVTHKKEKEVKAHKKKNVNALLDEALRKMSPNKNEIKVGSRTKPTRTKVEKKKDKLKALQEKIAEKEKEIKTLLKTSERTLTPIKEEVESVNPISLRTEDKEALANRSPTNKEEVKSLLKTLATNKALQDGEKNKVEAQPKTLSTIEKEYLQARPKTLSTIEKECLQARPKINVLPETSAANKDEKGKALTKNIPTRATNKNGGGDVRVNALPKTLHTMTSNKVDGKGKKVGNKKAEAGTKTALVRSNISNKKKK